MYSFSGSEDRFIAEVLLQGDDQSAVQSYLHACSKEPSYVHRGNLDPEISALIKRYGLNARKDDDNFDF